MRQTSKKRRVRKKVKKQQQQYVPLQRVMKKLVRLNGKKRQQALQQANDVFIRKVSSAVKAIRRKPVSNKIRAKLRRHRKALHALADPRLSLQSKRRVIVRQKGGFFGAVLASLAAPLIAPIVSTVLKPIIGTFTGKK